MGRYYNPKYSIGGRILKRLQEGGPIRRTSVQYGTPEYRKAYEEGRVATNFDHASMTYDLQDLPEFTVTGKDERVKDSMSKAGSKFWNVAGDLISEPQRKMVEGLTGTYQYPSEAWGFQKPGGWTDSFSSFGKNLSNTVMDGAVDPLNVLGVGLIDDVTKGGVRELFKNEIKDVGRAFSKDKVYRNFLKNETSVLDKTLLSTIYNKPIKQQLDKGVENLDFRHIQRQNQLAKTYNNLKYNQGAKLRFNQLYKDKLLQNHPDKLNYDAISDHPTYFSFLKEKGLLESTLASSENLSSALNNKELVDEFWNSFKKSQRGIATRDQSVINDALLLGDDGQWGRGNYSSNSDMILDKFSTPREGKRGYQGQLELNLPDVESASGIDKLNRIKEKFASSMNKNFESKKDRDEVIGIIANYGGETSAERVIKREAIDKQPDLLKLSNVVENLGAADENVLKKVGTFGLRESESTGKHFTYDISVLREPRSKLGHIYNKAMSELPADKRKKFETFQDGIYKEYNSLQEKISYLKDKKNKSYDELNNLREYQYDIIDIKDRFDQAAKKAFTSAAGVGVIGTSGAAVYNVAALVVDQKKDQNLKKYNEYNKFLNSPENSEMKGKLDSLHREIQKIQFSNEEPFKKNNVFRSFRDDKEFTEIRKRKVNSPDESVNRDIDSKTRQLELLQQMGYGNNDLEYQKRLTNVPEMKKGGRLKYSKGGEFLQQLFGEGNSPGEMSPGAMGAGILGSLIPTDSVGGKTASSALTGFMSAGPIGALAGGAMGLVSGLANKRREEEDESKRMELETRMFRNHSRSVLSNYPTEGVDSSGFYKSGGRMKSHDFMTTGGYLSPVASDTSIANGRTHNEGGIDLYDESMDNFAEIEDQEIIKQDKVYSNRLKVPVYLQQALKLRRK